MENTEVIVSTNPYKDQELVEFINNLYSKSRRMKMFFHSKDGEIYWSAITDQEVINFGKSLGLDTNLESIIDVIMEKRNKMTDEKKNSIRNLYSDAVGRIEEQERAITESRRVNQDYNKDSQLLESFDLEDEEFDIDSVAHVHSKYQIWHISSKLFNQYYGGIMIYIYDNYAYIESITRYAVPLLFHEAYPYIIFPSLNRIIVPVIEQVLKNKGVNRIYVGPLDIQMKILKEKFGFVNVVDNSTLPPKPVLVNGNIRQEWLVKYL